MIRISQRDSLLASVTKFKDLPLRLKIVMMYNERSLRKKREKFRKRCGDVCGVCFYFDSSCTSPVVGYCKLNIKNDPKRFLANGVDFDSTCDDFLWRYNYKGIDRGKK